MKKIQFYCSIVFTILSLSVYAQKEASNWFYGSGQGITWNRTQTMNLTPNDNPNISVSVSGIPTKYDSRTEIYPMSTREGCFALSDTNGKLMFYSDGVTIYNANHYVLENGEGLEGHRSSAQSGIIIPYPGNRNKYVAVSIGIAGERVPKFAYNILDSQANNGLGRLELPKNRQFTLPQGVRKEYIVESLAATKHANGVDYWIIVISRSGLNPKMISWLLTKDGISQSPVVSPITGLTMKNDERTYGYLKISPDGKHFALAMHEAHNLFWGEFNNRTGQFSNMKDYFSITNRYILCYGAEFSPDGNYFYLSAGRQTGTLVYVFDFKELLRGNTAFLKTYDTPAFTRNYTPSALQLGPDFRLYLTMSEPALSGDATSVLYMFDKPDEPLSTNVYALYNLSPGIGSGNDGGSGTRMGLPTFASSFFVRVEGTSTICVGEEAVYKITSNAQRLEIDFDEGDGPQIINNTSEVKHVFKKPGNYLIRLRPLNSQGVPIQDEIKTVYTTVYSCFLPVNHNLSNAEY